MPKKKRVFSGPVRPGTNRKVFRETGESIPAFQGPVRPGTDEEVFRSTGRSVRSSSPVLGPTRETLEAEQRRQEELRVEKQAEQRRSSEEQSRRESQQEQRVFFSREQGDVDQGRFIPKPESEQFAPPDPRPSDIVVRTRGGTATGRGSGPVLLQSGISTTGRLVGGGDVRPQIADKIRTFSENSQERSQSIPQEIGSFVGKSFREIQQEDGLQEKQFLTTRVIDIQDGIPQTEVVQVDEFGTFLGLATPEQSEKFRKSKQSELVISSDKPSGFFETFRSNVAEQRTANLRGDSSFKAQLVGGFGGGVASQVVNTADFIKREISSPISQKPSTLAIGGVVNLMKTASSRSVGENAKALGRVVSSGGKSVGQVIRQEPGFAFGVAAGIAAEQLALAKATQFLTKSTLITKPLRPLETPLAIEKSAVVINKGKPFRVSTFEILGETKPPRIQFKTSRLSGGIPRNVKVLSSEDFRIFTPELVVNKKPFFIAETKQGSKVVKLSEVVGDSRPVNLRTEKLTNIEKFLAKSFAEKKTTGLPTSEKTFRQLFPRNARFEFGGLRVQKKASVNIQNRQLTLISNWLKNKNIPQSRLRTRFGGGKTTTQFQTLTRIKPFLKTDKVEVFTGQRIGKDVTKRFSRATGKTPQLKEILIQVKDPIILNVESPNVIKPMSITKTSLSKTFQKQIVQLQKQPPLPKPIINVKQFSQTAKIVPQGTASFQGSKFAGLGLFERTSGGSVSPSTFQKEIVSPKLIQGSFPTLMLKQEPLLRTRTVQRTLQKPVQRGVQRLVPRTTQRGVQRNVQKTTQKTLQRQIQKLIQRTTQRIPITPSFRIMRGGSKKGGFLPRLPKIQQPLRSRDSFKVFERRFGKFKSIGTATTLGRAVQIGRQRVSTTLGASFRIEGLTTPLKIPGFRTKKEKTGLVFIEPRSRRLSTASEVSSIQSFLKKSMKVPSRRRKRKKKF